MNVPEPVLRLQAWLERQPFVKEAELDGSGFGDRLLAYRWGAVSVRLVADRGQWFVDVGAGEEPEWFDMDLWQACLGGSLPPEANPFEAQAERLMSALPAIRAALEPDRAAGTMTCLRETRERRARMLGFLPEDGS